MKLIIKKKLTREMSPFFDIIETYDFDKLYFKRTRGDGLALCYFITSILSKFTNELTLKSTKNETDDIKWIRTYNVEKFRKLCPTMNLFNIIYDVPDFGSWTLNVALQNVAISISGTKDSRCIDVSYSEFNNTIDTEKIFSNIENAINDFLE